MPALQAFHVHWLIGSALLLAVLTPQLPLLPVKHMSHSTFMLYPQELAILDICFYLCSLTRQPQPILPRKMSKNIGVEARRRLNCHSLRAYGSWCSQWTVTGAR